VQHPYCYLGGQALWLGNSEMQACGKGFWCYSFGVGKIITIILWAGTSFCGQPLWGNSASVGMLATHNVKKKADPTANNTKTGTKEFPFVVDTEGHHKSDDETAKDKREDDYKHFIDRRTLDFARDNTILAGLLALAV
jgi:hypothetical protein